MCNLIDALADDGELPALDIRLVARRRARLEVIAAHAAARIARRSRDHVVSAWTDLEGAARGAGVVVLLVRVGGMAARARDERIPADYGYVGDEGVGVGGLANAWRTVPVLSGIADVIGRVAPAALVVNLMAPLGITTRLLVDRGLRAVGLCELPDVTRARLLEASADLPADSLAYAGLNHLGFFWPTPDAGDCARRALWAAGRACQLSDASHAGDLGAVPLHYYLDVYAPEVARRIGRPPRRPGRAEALVDLHERMLARFAHRPGSDSSEPKARATPWFDLAVAPVIGARLLGRECSLYTNEPNGDVLPEVPGGVVVELPAVVTGVGSERRMPPPRPPAVREFLGRAGVAEDLAYRACVSRDRSMLADALRAAPLHPTPDDPALLEHMVADPEVAP